MDDGEHADPTRENIMNEYKKLTESQPGDVVYCHYSGHGGKLKDDDWGEEEDGYDETLIPVDYATAGQIRDDDLLTTLVMPMLRGVFVTCVMDCCHSGTVLDLPYNYKVDGEHISAHANEAFNFEPMLTLLASQATVIAEQYVDQACCCKMQ